ncbi:MAG: DUF1016 family protein [Deltaproteobacteria bacterium]|nr:DUF1016 family protein [Deltaproteobacteria bacterium]
MIDLKVGKLTHQDLGQLQFYVNYFDRERRTGGSVGGAHPTSLIVIKISDRACPQSSCHVMPLACQGSA